MTMYKETSGYNDVIFDNKHLFGLVSDDPSSINTLHV